MTDEIEWARATAVEALSKNPTLVPWAFEFTPASSEGAVETYLDKVRDCDIFVWLVSNETTSPVEREIRLALELRKRFFWVILLPAERRDSLTNDLLADVRERVKYAEVEDAARLRELLTLTFSDEVIRAMREKPQPEYTRLAYLEALGRRSRARMVNRWTATGLNTLEAIAFADNPDVAAPPLGVLPKDDRRLQVLVADGGAGKSVVAERALQQAIVQAREWEGAPIPAFLYMRDAKDGLELALRGSTDEVGDIRLQGTFAVVDGADEVPTEIATRVIEEARELIAALPQTHFLITSRSTTAVRNIEERVNLPLLDADEARALVGQIAGYEVTVGMEGGWSPSLREAVRRPMYAILLGLNRRRQRPEPQTRGELLNSLVEDALPASEVADFVPLLTRLAALVTDRGGPIEASEIGGLSERVATDASRLVHEEDGLIDFALPLVTQWFAAEALINGDVDVEELAAAGPRLDRWRYALAIALSRGSIEFVESAMAVLVRESPGFAAEIIEESFHRWTSSAAPGAPTPSIEAGERLRKAFETWGAAIEPLDQRLLPRDENGSLPTLGIRAAGGQLAFGWGLTGDPDRLVAELPSDLNPFEPPAEWRIRRFGQWGNERGWAWRLAQEILRSDLKRLVEARALESDNPALLDEAIWLIALLAGRRGSLSHDPVPFEELEPLITQLDLARPLIRLNDRMAPTELVLRRLSELKDAGVTQLRSPWPPPDRARAGGVHIWDPYTPEQQVARTAAVYGAALEAYADIVERWFPKLRSRMRIAVTLPATLRGTLVPSPPPPSTFDRVPTLSWHLEPLPLGETSKIDVTLSDGSPPAEQRGSEGWRNRLQARRQALVELRPEAVGWISTVDTHEVDDAFQGAPLAPLVYDWLKSDLRAIKWQ